MYSSTFYVYISYLTLILKFFKMLRLILYYKFFLKNYRRELKSVSFSRIIRICHPWVFSITLKPKTIEKTTLTVILILNFLLYCFLIVQTPETFSNSVLFNSHQDLRSTKYDTAYYYLTLSRRTFRWQRICVTIIVKIAVNEKSKLAVFFLFHIINYLTSFRQNY